MKGVKFTPVPPTKGRKWATSTDITYARKRSLEQVPARLRGVRECGSSET